MGRRLIYLFATVLVVGVSVAQTGALADPPAVPEESALPGTLESPPTGVPVGEPANPTKSDPLAEPPEVAPQPSAPALPAPSEPVPPPPSNVEPAPLDPAIVRAQGTKPLPVRAAPRVASAAPDPGAPPLSPSGSTAAGSGSEGTPFVVHADKLPLGKQSVALSVEVVGPATINVGKQATVKILIKNTGTADALGVDVRDELPEGVTVVSSQPSEQRVGDNLLLWHLTTVNAGSERAILLKIVATKVGALDHAATVTFAAGSKARTMVREPKLKVEQIATTGKVLKGRPVEFKIAVTNTGDGPARNVVIQAQLSPGLRADGGGPNDQNLFDQSFDVIEAGQRIEVDPLVADTIVGGEQTCKVIVSSPDVEMGLEGSQSTQVVTIVEPQLTMTLTGPDKRFTDTDATYTVTVTNPGTAPARNVQVVVSLPVSGRFRGAEPSASYASETRKLQWTLPQVEPGNGKEPVKLSFTVRMGGPGLYPVAAQAKADGPLYDKGTIQTDVQGIADVDLEVSARKRVVDVGDTLVYEIRVRNLGTKEASRLLISAQLSDGLVAKATDDGSDDPQQATVDKETGRKIAFRMKDRLPAGKEVTLKIQVQAAKAGQATCRVYLMHDDLAENDKLDDVATTRVTSSRQ